MCPPPCGVRVGSVPERGGCCDERGSHGAADPILLLFVSARRSRSRPYSCERRRTVVCFGPTKPEPTSCERRRSALAHFPTL